MLKVGDLGLFNLLRYLLIIIEEREWKNEDFFIVMSIFQAIDDWKVGDLSEEADNKLFVLLNYSLSASLFNKNLEE